MVGKLVPTPVKSKVPPPNIEVQDITTPPKTNIWYIQSEDYKARKETKLWEQNTVRFGSVFVIFMILIVMVWPILSGVNSDALFLLNRQSTLYNDNCSFEIVESIPEGLVFPNSTIKHVSTYETWKKLISIAQHSIEIGSFYWSLKKWKEFPVESQQGDDIFNDLLQAGLKRNILIKIAQNKPSKSLSKDDTEILVAMKAAQVKSLDFDDLIGTGVLHTKFWIVDRKHLYIGSANLDWRALNQVKELGIVMYNCSSIARDLAKIFEAYWIVGNKTTLPNRWPDYLNTNFNKGNPFKIFLNGHESSLFLSSAPPKFSASGRTEDIDAVLHVIKNAKKFIHISVMNYLPLVLYSRNLKYWSVIDDELRRAVVDRNVEVRLLVSSWPSTRPMENNFLRSLLALNNFKKGSVLEVKLFKVPSNSSQSKIPYARVNHNKYMVTDNAALIGTSNWSGDYFISTAGVSFVSVSSANQSVNVIQEQLKEIFDRDWFSPYASALPPQ